MLWICVSEMTYLNIGRYHSRWTMVERIPLVESFGRRERIARILPFFCECFEMGDIFMRWFDLAKENKHLVIVSVGTMNSMQARHPDEEKGKNFNTPSSYLFLC